VLLPHVIEANLATLRGQPDGGPAPAKYADVGRALTGNRTMGDDEAARACVRWTTGLILALKLPPLRRFGVDEAAVPEIVALAGRASSMRYNPVRHSETALASILRRAL
jgi:alcohol dehydrogenase class IV